MTNPPPLLDLAPKRKTPLSLWNPFDYVLLLYWVFFFPQALRWYLETFRKVEYKHRNRIGRDFLQVMRDDTVQRNLFFQGLILRITLTIFICWLLTIWHIEISWPAVGFGIMASFFFSAAFGLAGGVSVGTVLGISGCVTAGVAFGVSFGMVQSHNVIANWVMTGLIYSAELGIILGIAGGIGLGLAFSANGGVALAIIRNSTLYVSTSLAGGAAIFITLNIIFGSHGNLSAGFLFSLFAGLAFILTQSLGANICNLRLLEFSLAWLPTFLAGKNTNHRYPILGRVISIPLPGLHHWLHTQLQNDPAAGLHNINQLLRYSLQFIPVVSAINDWLNNLRDEELYAQVDALANTSYDFHIVRLGSASLSNVLWREALDGFVLLPYILRKKLREKLSTSLRIDTYAHAACAGYWLMHNKDTEAAIAAFSVTRHIRHGEILYQTTQALNSARKAENLQAIVTWEHENTWLEQSIHESLRPQVVAVLRYLCSTAREADVAVESISRLNRSAALGRAVATLTELLNDVEFVCPEMERPIVREIAKKWRDILAIEAGKAGHVAITQPVENPFVAGNPVTGGVFVGREEIFRRIEELWGASAGQVVPSLVLFGHRRMGKSSILQNLGGRRFGIHTIVTQFTMQRAGRLKSTGELLAIFAAKIQEALAEKGTLVPEPDFAYFEQSPYVAFDRFLKAARQNIAGRRLILTIDEFELIEDAIQRRSVDDELLSYLRGVIHSEPWFVLALAGLHTLEEMTADYWNPLFSSVTPLRVSFLSWEATANLLANPLSDFPLDFTQEAVNRVYAHVHGQPFLTQLIGHTLVRLYNQSVFEDRSPREPLFSADDVDDVVERPEFYEQGHYYFQGVWSQAQGLPAGQTTLLKRLAEAEGPLSKKTWLSGLDESITKQSLKALEQHDVVLLNDDLYDFAVPLMRRWLMKGVK